MIFNHLYLSKYAVAVVARAKIKWKDCKLQHKVELWVDVRKRCQSISSLYFFSPVHCCFVAESLCVVSILLTLPSNKSRYSCVWLIAHVLSFLSPVFVHLISISFYSVSQRVKVDVLPMFHSIFHRQGVITFNHPPPWPHVNSHTDTGGRNTNSTGTIYCTVLLWP